MRICFRLENTHHFTRGGVLAFASVPLSGGLDFANHRLLIKCVEFKTR
jgi:hypothetical protein